jgi:hypothetical protein
MHTGFWWGDLRENDQLEYVGVDGRTILKGISRIGIRYLESIDLNQGRDGGARL